MGYAIVLNPEAPQGVAGEWDTFTCSHCQYIVDLKPGQGKTEGGNGWCFGCAKPLCPSCANRYERGHGCEVWEKQMDQAERREALRRAAGV